jgi:hypothetical protein
MNTVGARRCRHRILRLCMNIEIPASAPNELIWIETSEHYTAVLANSCSVERFGSLNHVPRHIGMLPRRRRAQAAGGILACCSCCYQRHTCFQDKLISATTGFAAADPWIRVFLRASSERVIYCRRAVGDKVIEC